MLKSNYNQAIICSGVSGSGKSYTARLIIEQLHELAHVKAMTSRNSPIDNFMRHMENLIESLCHAKSAANDNSSRCSRLTGLFFDENYRVVGANVERKAGAEEASFSI